MTHEYVALGSSCLNSHGRIMHLIMHLLTSTHHLLTILRNILFSINLILVGSIWRRLTTNGRLEQIGVQLDTDPCAVIDCQYSRVQEECAV